MTVEWVSYSNFHSSTFRLHAASYFSKSAMEAYVYAIVLYMYVHIVIFVFSFCFPCHYLQLPRNKTPILFTKFMLFMCTIHP